MNIKYISLAISAVAIASLIAACTKNQIDGSTINTGSAGLNGQLVDLELASVSSKGTKAVIEGTEFPQTGEIGLFLFKDEMATQDYGTGYENIKYLYDSGKKKWTASPSIKVGSTPGYLYGYYPYNSGNTDVKAIPVSSSVNGDDVMYASKQAEPITDKTAANTSITMNHALARVSITVKNNGYTGDAKLTSIKFEGAKTAQTGTLNALDGSITASKSNVTLEVPSDDQTITKTGTTYECLLIPSEKEGNKQAVTLTLTIDGEAKSATLSGNDNGVIIAQGTKSNITITLSNTGITVQTVSVEDWTVVEVGGHKVTIQMADAVLPHDILTEAYADGSTAKIVAFSQSGKGIVCSVTNGATCTGTKTNNINTFTISNITSNITATIGYKPVESITLDRTSVNPAQGWKVYLSAKVLPADAGNKNIVWSSSDETVASVDANGNISTLKQGEVTITATASDDSGVTATCTLHIGSPIEGSLSYEFSVSGTKKVHFSKGNLYNQQGLFKFENNQYDFPSSWNSGHVGHFYWSKISSEIFATKYSSPNASADQIFCTNNTAETADSSFEIESTVGKYRAVSPREWQYLFNYGSYQNDIRKDKYKCGVTVCGKENCVVIAPDSWDISANPLQSVYNSESSPMTWEQAEVNGLVCLPAAGQRSEDKFDGASSVGDYWSSSADNKNDAQCMKFDSTDVSPESHNSRMYGSSVRLVADYPN